MPNGPNEPECENPSSKLMLADCLSKARHYTRGYLTSLQSTTSNSLQSMTANCNCSGYTTTTSTCSQVAELTPVTVKITSTVSCPSTTVSFNCEISPRTQNTNGEVAKTVSTAVTTTSVLTTTVKASCNAMPTSANSSSMLPIAIISSVLTTLLVMIVAALIVVCLYIQLKKQCMCMHYIMVECGPIYVLI